jgi:anaerobic dimethyl sulfoxide reductase subunit B (iron-sulfur subunit)
MPNGNAGKCDGCYSIRATGGEAACSASCPNRALECGDFADLQAKHGSGTTNEIAILPAASTTTPSLMIKAKDAATKSNFVEVNW